MSVIDYIRLFRPLNALMGGVGVIAGAVISGGLDIVHRPVLMLLGFLVAVFFAGGGNSLNDYYDRDIDKKNHPHRPLPSGALEPRSALVLSALSFTLCLMLSLPAPLIATAVLVLAVILMVSYEVKLKALGLPGNVAVSWITATSFLYGGSLVSGFRGLYLVGIFFLLAFLSNLGREIIKDVEDAEGDVGRRTLPMSIGKPKATTAAAVFVLAAVCLSPLPYFLGYYQGLGLWVYLGIVAVCDLVFLSSVFLMFRPKEGFSTSKVTKFAMFIGLLAFVLGKLLC